MLICTKHLRVTVSYSEILYTYGPLSKENSTGLAKFGFGKLVIFILLKGDVIPVLLCIFLCAVYAICVLLYVCMTRWEHLQAFSYYFIHKQNKIILFCPSKMR